MKMLMVLFLVSCFFPVGWAEEPTSMSAPSSYDVSGWGVGALGVGALSTLFMTRSSPGAWNSGGILFDDSVRNALVIGSSQGRQDVGSATDLGRELFIAAPFLLDSVGLLWLRDHNSDRALNVALMDAESMLLMTVIVDLTKYVAGRPRPYSTQCVTNPGYDSGCGSNDQNVSFFSGHSAIAFTGATLLCQNHGADGLLHSDWGDRAVCWGSLALASAVGVGRIAADQHYATDVLTGAAVGILAGWYFPKWMKHDGSDNPRGIQHSMTLVPGPAGGMGLGEMFIF